MEHRNDHPDSSMSREGSQRETPGNDGNHSMIEHVINLLSALVSIIGIINDNVREDTNYRVKPPRMDQLRKQEIGGSDAGAVCGLNPYRSQMNVFLDKTSAETKEFNNEASASATIWNHMWQNVLCRPRA